MELADRLLDDLIPAAQQGSSRARRAANVSGIVKPMQIAVVQCCLHSGLKQ